MFSLFRKPIFSFSLFPRVIDGCLPFILYIIYYIQDYFLYYILVCLSKVFQRTIFSFVLPFQRESVCKGKAFFRNLQIFSKVFLKKYLPYTVELGRSFVTLEYQSTRAGSKGLFALDNLWDGLGALTVIKPNVKYFFGKMTMYPSYHRQGRDMILYFLNKHFGDKDKLITPMKPLEIETDKKMLENLFCYDSFKEDYKILNTEVRKLGYNIPPLVNAYMSLSPTMRMFGTAINYGFGDVEETGILIAVNEILEDKRVRHIESFVKQHPEAMKITSGAHPILTK